MILIASEEATNGVTYAISKLKAGSSILSSIEEGIKKVELDTGLDSVGLGGAPNALGYVELDAGMMDGRSLKSGSVGAITGYVHPISVAQKVLELLPHELLVGRGAEIFASELGLEKSVKAASEYQGNVRDQIYPKQGLWQSVSEDMRNFEGHDTVVILGKDRDQNFGVGASTSGIARKYPGRVGDSAIVGAGFYASNGVGAVACTGVGEMSMRLAISRNTVRSMELGLSVEDAVVKSLNDLRRLDAGFLGGVTIFAIDNEERHSVGTINNQSSRYFFWNEECTAEIPRFLFPLKIG